jgi:hypothetical protein
MVEKQAKAEFSQDYFYLQVGPFADMELFPDPISSNDYMLSLRWKSGIRSKVEADKFYGLNGAKWIAW